MDTVRADRLSCLGYDRDTTPNLDRLASEGALFTNAFAGDIPTQPSHTAVFTGRHGINSSIVSHFWPPASLAASIPWLPSILQAMGRPTGAVDHLFTMKEWFVRGYDDYLTPPGRSRSPAEVINEIAFPWIADHARDDFFLFLHYWDAHIPYVPPSSYIDRFVSDAVRRPDPENMSRISSRPSYALFKRTHYDHLYDFLGHIPSLEYIASLYDAEVAYLDHHLGRLRTHLERLGILDDTMLVLFADHGENMTEHDAWFDHAGLYDSVVHVPLIIRHPATVAPCRVDAMVQPIDIMPTVCEAIGLTVPPGVDGVSLAPLMRGERTEQYDVVHLSEATWQATRGLRTSRWKYLRSYDPGIYGRTDPQLYDVLADPDEQLNLAGAHPDVVADLDGRMRRWLDEQLRGRPDPMLEVIASGLPAVARLHGILAEDRELAERGHGP